MILDLESSIDLEIPLCLLDEEEAAVTTELLQWEQSWPRAIRSCYNDRTVQPSDSLNNRKTKAKSNPNNKKSLGAFLCKKVCPRMIHFNVDATHTNCRHNLTSFRRISPSRLYFTTVIQNLRMLQKQQEDAQMNLLHVQQVQKELLQHQKQKNLLLEGKKFSNGETRGELDKFRDFLSFAFRKIGDRKLASEKLDADINSFQRRLEGGIKSATMIKICTSIIDSTLASVEDKVRSLNSLNDKCSAVLQHETEKYEETKREELELRSSLHDAQTSIQKWAQDNKTLSSEILKLEVDKVNTEKKEEEAKLHLRSVREAIKNEEGRFARVEEEHLIAMEDLGRQHEAFLEEINMLESTLKASEMIIEKNKKEIIGVIKVEGWELNGDDAFDSNEFNAAIACAEASLQSKVREKEVEVLSLAKEIKDMEDEFELIEKETSRKDGQSTALQLKARTILEGEEKRKEDVTDVESHLANGRVELAKLKGTVEYNGR
jgi:hypothetical protein